MIFVMEDYRLEEELLHLGVAIEIKRRKLEYLCKQHSALFQPWPKRKQKEDNDEIKNIPNEKSVPKLTPEEQTELEMVHKVLCKAEKARTRHKVSELREKLETTDELVKQVDLLKHSNSIKENGSPMESVISEKTDENLADLPSKWRGIAGNADVNCGSATNPPTVQRDQKHNTSNKILQNSKSSNKKSNTFPLNSCMSNKVCPESDKRQAAFSSGPIKNCTRPQERYKPSSSVFKASRPQCSSAKVPYQAHRNAPFKTDPNIRVPGRAKVSRSKQTGVVLNHSKSAASSGGLRSASAPTLESEKLQILKKQEVPQNQRPEQQIQSKDSEVVHDVSEQGLPVCTESNDSLVLSPVSVTTELASEMKAVTLPKEVEVKSQEKECDESKMFCLVTDGSKLSIPGKLRRLFANNCRLRQKYAKLKVTRKVKSSDLSSDFVEKIENEFDAPHNLLIQRRLLSCLQCHKTLLDLLDKLNLTSINELSPPVEVIQAKMMAEFILTSFDSLQQECSELMTVDLPGAHWNETSKIYHKTKTPPLRWIPSNTVFGYEGPPCPSSLSYQSSTELRVFHHAVFQIQLLHLHVWLIESVKTQLLPLLCSMDPSSQAFIQTFRGTYALLTSDGQHQPGIVGDTLEEVMPTGCS